jgi:hypothetical protein
MMDRASAGHCSEAAAYLTGQALLALDGGIGIPTYSGENTVTLYRVLDRG